jgi:hypothetical protein
MSEYQYFEWQTVDRPLTAREQSDVDGLSSHMDTVTSTQAIVTYSWGDFKHDPKQVLLKYFDAFLYDSNFGMRELMFRLPKKLVDVDLFEPYLIEEQIILEQHGAYFVLHIGINEDADYFEWIESENILGQLTPLREQLLQGDTRMLYLAWLKVISLKEEEWEDESEPPVPAGLKKLTASLQAFAEFFEIDPHLVSSAAEASKKAESNAEADLESAIAKLSRKESETYLLQIAKGEPGAVLSLKKRLMELGGQKSPARLRSTRTVSHLFSRSDEITEAAKRKARADAEHRRIRRLEELAGNEDVNWQYVEKLLQQKRGSTYEEATKLLVELRDMSVYKQREDKFRERFNLIREKYGKSVALMERFRRASLM